MPLFAISQFRGLFCESYQGALSTNLGFVSLREIMKNIRSVDRELRKFLFSTSNDFDWLILLYEILSQPPTNSPATKSIIFFSRYCQLPVSCESCHIPVTSSSLFIIIESLTMIGAKKIIALLLVFAVNNALCDDIFELFRREDPCVALCEKSPQTIVTVSIHLCVFRLKSSTTFVYTGSRSIVTFLHKTKLMLYNYFFFL